jgi:hypothetical protein
MYFVCRTSRWCLTSRRSGQLHVALRNPPSRGHTKKPGPRSRGPGFINHNSPSKPVSKVFLMISPNVRATLRLRQDPTIQVLIVLII